MRQRRGTNETFFENKKFAFLMMALLTTIIIDTAIVKINDLVDKNLIPLYDKLILFAINSVICLGFQFIILRYVSSSFKKFQLAKKLKVRASHLISFITLSILACGIGFLILEQFFNGYYDTRISILIISMSYGISGLFLAWLSYLFLSWYKSSRNMIVLLYFVSISIIVFNLITTATLASVKLSARPIRTGEYVGASGDVSGGKYQLLNDLYKISSIMSFFSIWLTTAVLMSSYRDKLVKSITYWVILSVPVAYFFITYFYQYILGNLFISYLEADPVTVSIIFGAFLSLSKPIGGLVFGLAFWNISKIVSYERNIRVAMTIAGWGILLIFITNQASLQIVGPYPVFGIASLTVLNVAGYLMLLGIYTSANLVSVNNDIRKFIHKHALESRLLGLVGQAEMESEIQKTVKKIADDEKSSIIKTEQPIELDEMELKKYVGLVLKEVRKDQAN